MLTDFPLASSAMPRRNSFVPTLATRSHLTGRNSVSRHWQVREFAMAHLADDRMRQRVFVPLAAKGLRLKARIADTAQATSAAPTAQHSGERFEHADSIQ
ncbi:hypothetical protein CCR90_07895 [Rhodovulum sulfidophilum]|uniref:hypothetical protein n=1 Tax=Rhodovulum sulfidophilum TaxID=35806 RepID=UPI0019118E4C|nr:hypothetical protein [Rhodovulum sulfidophilum]MBK5923708.1 hypothetical protein [Rhodovulum sulfidophilum]